MQSLNNCSRGRWEPFRAAWEQRTGGLHAKAAWPTRQLRRAGGCCRSLPPQSGQQHRVQARALAAVAQATLPELPALDGSYEERCAFSAFSNWLIPGHVMLGRYPYVEPSRCTSAEQGESQLRRILGAGITTFVCLQEELPAQAELKIGGKDGFLPYKATATLLAAALSDPPSLEEVAALRTPQLNKFLPPRRKAGPSPASQRRRIELDFAYCPIVDLGVPTEERLAALLDELAERLAHGERLYIHCWGGRGRAGTVGACLLAKLWGMDADEALARVDRAFSTRQDINYRSPETPEQQQFVREFIANLQK